MRYAVVNKSPKTLSQDLLKEYCNITNLERFFIPMEITLKRQVIYEEQIIKRWILFVYLTTRNAIIFFDPCKVLDKAPSVRDLFIKLTKDNIIIPAIQACFPSDVAKSKSQAAIPVKCIKAN